MKHTIGPWESNGRDVFDYRNNMIASTGRMGADTNAANAKLIAAAPEMLAALIEAADELDELSRFLRYMMKDSTDTEKTLGIVLSAIEKARGDD